MLSGTLAFELEDGSINLPPPEQFIRLLRRSPRLQCVFLNACHTKELGMAIVQALPHLRVCRAWCAHHRAHTRAHAPLPCCLAQVICWDSALHDSAARAFSRGFYKAIGNDARARISSAVNAAHVAFKAGGFKVRRVAYPRRGTDVAVQRAHRGWGVRLVTAQRGRPEIYWHPPNHYHRELIAQHKKVPSTCLGCFPPCHGMPVLLVAQREDA